MTKPAAITGSYAQFQLVPTRKVVKVVVEAPIEQAQQIVDVLGLPGANEEQWLAVAKLRADGEDEAEAETPKPRGPKATNRIAAVMLCKNELFWQFLTKTDWCCSSEEGAADYVRKRCGVASRTDLDGNEEAAKAFWKIHGAYHAWRSGEVA